MPVDLTQYLVLQAVGDCGDYWYLFDQVLQLRGAGAIEARVNQEIIEDLRHLMRLKYVVATPVRNERMQRLERTTDPDVVDWSCFNAWRFRSAEEMIREGLMKAPPYDFALTESGRDELTRAEYEAFREELRMLE